MDFPDVTLASEDDQQEEANKVVLSSASQKLRLLEGLPLDLCFLPDLVL